VGASTSHKPKGLHGLYTCEVNDNSFAFRSPILKSQTFVVSHGCDTCGLVLREHKRKGCFENRALKRIFESKGRDVTASVVQWSEFLATDPEVRVRFPGLPDFLRSSGSGTGSTQPREYN
jgi:hypothetical protein